MSDIVSRGGLPAEHGTLLDDLRALIRDARQRVAHAANSALTMTYWRLGKRLLTEELAEGRGEYGRQILAPVSQELEAEFGRGFSYSSLTRMVRFAELFPDEGIVASPMQELTWTHIRLLLPIRDRLAREFHAEMCRAERWSVRTLRERVGGMLYERTALSRNSEEVIRRELAALRSEGRMTPDLVFLDPYLLDFLGRAARSGRMSLPGYSRCADSGAEWLSGVREPVQLCDPMDDRPGTTGVMASGG